MNTAALILRRFQAFTIVELLASTAVFIGLMLLLVTATNQTGEMWRRSSTKVEQFQQARRGFEVMTRRISQATLNTYWDYLYPTDSKGAPDRTQVPLGYVRQSELRIRTGIASKLVGEKDAILRPTHGIFFQAPLGFVEDDVAEKVDPAKTHKPLNNLLNTWGYFLEVDDDSREIPEFLRGLIPTRTRSRLMELMEPSETFKMDNPSQKRDEKGNIITADPNWDNPKYLDWFIAPIQRRTPVRVVSENVLALVILPRLTPQDEAARLRATPPKKEVLCPLYDYDSKRLSNTAAGIANPKQKAPDPELNPKNQLPPVVTVAMVAIDEGSAQRLSAVSPGDKSFGLDMKSLFLDSRKLEDDPGSAEAGDGDLSKLEQQLIEKKLTYRIFTSNVAIRGAKWSRWQEN